LKELQKDYEQMESMLFREIPSWELILKTIEQFEEEFNCVTSTLYNFMTSSLTLVSHEIAKIKIDRELPIVHNLCCSKTKGYGNGLSISQYFIGSSPFLGTFF
jgi:hypothetical protein